jgi:NADH dehydrogenase
MTVPNSHAHRVLILGGGFGGLAAAQALRRVPVQVTLLDRRNFHLFQPLLYQVATGGLSPANIAAPLRSILRRQRNIQVLLAEATDIDVAERAVVTSVGRLTYDTLIVAVGVRHSYFGHDDWEAFAPGLKTLEDATTMRRRILQAFEAAEATDDVAVRRAWLTFVVVGAGPTGVELAGALGELAHHTLRGDFRRIDPASARIVLLEGTERVLPAYPPDLSAKAQRALARLGVEVLTGAKVTWVAPDHVCFERGGATQTLITRTVLWGAGVQASPLGRLLAERTGAELDRVGRVVVEPNLTLKGHPELLVIGDLAHCRDREGRPLPGVAPVAMQQGRYVARWIADRLAGRSTPPFAYHDRGSMATIGRGAAVADLGWVRLSGYPAWLAWLFIHLAFLIGFHNRLLVMIQWAWCYVTRNRAARLITKEGTGACAPPQEVKP